MIDQPSLGASKTENGCIAMLDCRSHYQCAKVWGSFQCAMNSLNYVRTAEPIQIRLMSFKTMMSITVKNIIGISNL